jgi:Protein of unknown function (DUF3093)
LQDSLAHVTYREVIRPPLWVLAFIYFLFLSLVLAIWAALDNRSALISWIASTLAIFALAYIWRREIVVESGELRVGKAHIELRYIAGCEALTGEQMRLLRTRDADPAAYLALAFWMPSGVKISLNDSRDPTPYWLISCKKSEELTRTLYKLL